MDTPKRKYNTMKSNNVLWTYVVKDRYTRVRITRKQKIKRWKIKTVGNGNIT